MLGSGIPDKGKVLTQLSAFWFERTAGIVAHHLLSTDMADLPADLQPHREMLQGQSMLVKKTTPLAIECVARGYLRDRREGYQATGAVCGVALPPGLRESDRLPAPIFTPATKASTGHDINISEADAGALIGKALVAEVRTLTLALYTAGAAHAESRGIILADTKFEFGVADDGALILIDEVMTPDSSGSWRINHYAPGGRNPASTSSSSATISNRFTGTSNPRCRRFQTTWSRRPAKNTWKRSGA